MAVLSSGKVSRRALLGGGAVAVLAGGSAFALRSKPRMQRRLDGDTKTLHRGNGAEPDTLDPHLAVTDWENNIIGDMFLGLMTEDAAARPIPGAAESYSASADGLTYTFKLRKHRWSDGVPVTANDFVYSFRRILDPKTAAQYASILYGVKNAEAVNAGKLPLEALGVRALDPRTFQVTFNYQVPYLAQLMTHYATFAVPQHVVEKHGSAWTRPENIVCNGPYVLKDWVANDHIELIKNKRFYDAAHVPLERVYFYPTPDATAALKRYRGGEFDVLSDTIAPQQTEWLKREMPRDLHLTPFMATTYVTFNFEQKPFDDLRVRTALSMAIDREILTRKITRGGETAAYALVPPHMPGYPGKAQLGFRPMPRAARLADARDLLKEAGFGPHNRLRFSYNLPMTTEAKIVGVTLQEMWREVSADVQLLMSEAQVHYDLMRRQDFAVGWTAWSADYLDAKDFLFLLASSSKDLNYGRYDSPLYDTLLMRSDMERDQTLRAELLQHAEQRMLDDMAIAPVYYGVTRDLVSTRVKGWFDNVVNINRTRFLSLQRSPASV